MAVSGAVWRVAALTLTAACVVGTLGAAPAGAVPAGALADEERRGAEDFLTTGMVHRLTEADARQVPTKIRRPVTATTPPTTQVPPSCDPQQATRTVTVVDFNIHFARKDGQNTLDEIAGVLKGSGADVVLLQEVDRFRRRSGYVDQPAWLGAQLGMYHSFGANVVRNPEGQGQPRSEYGVAILSRFPIVEATNTHLPNRRGMEQRGLLRTRLDVDGWSLDVYNTHWQHTSGSMRQEQAAAVSRLMSEDPVPDILGGDMNAKPGTPEMRTTTASMVDSWVAGGTGAGNTAPASRPGKRIDYLLHREPIAVTRADVLATGWISDHLPVRVVYEIPTVTLCLPEGDLGLSATGE